MSIRKLRDAWERWGRSDPMWAVLTAPDKKGGTWGEEEFFATGESEIAEALQKTKRFGMPLSFGSALDFGCGVGRLTQALSKHFEHVIGVDIAPSMLAKARELNREGSRVDYVLNQGASLSLFDDALFDLVYSNLTLQHLPPKLSVTYLAEFARVLKRGGCLIFQLPSERRRQSLGWRRVLRRLVPAAVLDGVVRWRVRRSAARVNRPAMDVYAIPQLRVSRVLLRRGLRVERVEEKEEAGSVWLSCWYYATKPAT